MERSRKAIILAGGSGSRLSPLTTSISKQILPIYDKPMIYYALTVLMLAKIREFLIITSPRDNMLFRNLLGNGEKFGISIEYKVQDQPNGIAEAFILGENFIKESPSALILGDNLFYGDDLIKKINIANSRKDGATVFAYQVKDPERYGVVNFDKSNNIIDIEEKPINPQSNFVITGLYFYDKNVVDYAKNLKPSNRGELEITSINKSYLNDKKLNLELLGRGNAWLDTGTFESLLEASNFIRTIENRQGLKIGSPEEIAWKMKWINDKQLIKLAEPMCNNDYGKYLLNLLN